MKVTQNHYRNKNITSWSEVFSGQIVIVGKCEKKSNFPGA